MDLVYISGSPRKNGNTDQLLQKLKEKTGGQFIRICDAAIKPCKSCWKCIQTGKCCINDDMTNNIIPRILNADVLIVGTPVFFNNVTAQLKAFIDRTWSIRGQLKNKIGASVVVCRRYGAESAITAIHAFFLKHQMIVANRGISGIAFKKSEILQDVEVTKEIETLSRRILELGKNLKK